MRNRELNLNFVGFVDADTKFTNCSITIERDLRQFSSYHYHNFIEIVYFEKGSGIHYIGENQYPVSGGDLYIINSGVRHGILSVESPLSLLNIMFKSDFLSEDIDSENFIDEIKVRLLGEKFKNDKGKTDFVHVVSKVLGDYSETVEKMLKEYENKQLFYVEYLRKNLEALLIQVFRDYYTEDNISGLTVAQKNAIESFIEKVDNNFCKTENFDEFINETGFCKLYFNRLFCKYTGMTILKYVRKKRIEKACRLLVETNDTVEAICEEVGYGDLKYFYSLFRSVVGATPGNFRKKALSKANQSPHK